jgi:hypothetical protein
MIFSKDFNICCFWLPLMPSIMVIELKKCLLITVFVISNVLISAQTVSYRVLFNQIFDNREYFSDYAFPQTIFGARLDAGLIFWLDSTNRFETGFNYLFEHGSDVFELQPQLTLYYAYQGERLDMAFGSFPRKDRITMPGAFLHDTLMYYRGNVEGAYGSLKGETGDVYAFIDWTGRVSDERRESFLAGLEGKLDFGPVFFQPSFLMYHNAHSFSPADSIPLQDNGIYSALLGFQWERGEGLFSGNISAGYLGSYNRYRPTPFSLSHGMISNINMFTGIFGMKGVYYFGGPIDFAYGDPFYQSGNYGRLDIFIDPFRQERIESRLGWVFHVVPGEGIHHSQQILIRVAF